MMFPECKQNDRTFLFLMLWLFSSPYIFIVLWWIRILWQMSKEAKECFFSFFLILEQKKINQFSMQVDGIPQWFTYVLKWHSSSFQSLAKYNFQLFIFFLGIKVWKILNPPTSKYHINEPMYMVLPPSSGTVTEYATSTLWNGSTEVKLRARAGSLPASLSLTYIISIRILSKYSLLLHHVLL